MTNNDSTVALYESVMRTMLEEGSNKLVIPLLNQILFKDHPWLKQPL